MVFVPKCYTWVYRLVLRVCKHWFTLLYMCAPLTHHCTLYRAGRAWKRSTSRQRRQLPETLVIRNDLFIYGYVIAIRYVGALYKRYWAKKLPKKLPKKTTQKN